MKFSLSYKVEEHGWATIYISDGIETIDSAVSYLHDSLLELAEMAISIKNGSNEVKAVFMDEPGELHFVVNVEKEKANYTKYAGSMIGLAGECILKQIIRYY